MYSDCTHFADEETRVETLGLVEDFLRILIVPEMDEGGTTGSLRSGIVNDASVADRSKLLEAVEMDERSAPNLPEASLRSTHRSYNSASVASNDMLRTKRVVPFGGSGPFGSSSSSSSSSSG